MITYYDVIIACWAAFLIVWFASAFGVKRDVQGGAFSMLSARYFLIRISIIVLVAFAVSWIESRGAHQVNIDAALLFTPPLWLGWLGAAMAVLGVLFAIWARYHLGRNWSPAPSMKEGHELVTSGPYRFVRHPIYTGVLFAILGAAITGTFFGIGVLVAGSVIFLMRIPKEERFMLGLFPDQYPAYQARTKRLIPFVW